MPLRMFRSIKTLRSIPRIKDIAFVLARHGFHQVAAYLQAPFSARLRRLFSKDSTPDVIHEPERLRLLLEDLGPTFIKFGQLLSTRPDLLPPPYIEELEKLQDRVQPSPHEEILEILSQDLGKDHRTLFREFDVTPLASASIGQVHRAVTHRGQQVVVKVRKKGLQKLVEQDLQVLKLLVEFIREWHYFRHHDLEGFLNQFERSIRGELDFTHERFNLNKMRELLRPDDPVIIPAVHDEFSSKRVLTMDFLPGQKFSEVSPEDLDNGRGEVLAKRLAGVVIRQIFEDGVFHADLHPGNIILMPEGKIGLIDFGSIGKCTPGMMDDLLLLIYYLIRRDFPLIARMVLKVGRVQKEVDVGELTYDIMDTLDPYYGLSMQDIELAGVFNSFFTISMRHQITLPPQYVLLARTLVSLEGVVSALAPDLEILAQLEPALVRVVRSRWAPGRIFQDVENSLTEIFRSLKSTPLHLAEILKRAAEGHLKIDTTLRNTETLEKRLEFIGHRVPLAILSASTIIGSAMLLNGESGGSLQTVLGCFGFIASMFLAFWMMMKN